MSFREFVDRALAPWAIRTMFGWSLGLKHYGIKGATDTVQVSSELNAWRIGRQVNKLALSCCQRHALPSFGLKRKRSLFFFFLGP
jgi:hypothetical protein